MNSFKYVHTVQYYETDKMGITHHSNYIRFMEEARVAFQKNMGWGYDRMEKDGMISPVISVSCDYKKTTTFSDEIEITVSVASLSRVKLTLSYVMIVRGETVCIASSTHCFLSQSGRPVSLQKQYPDFYNALAALVAE